MQTYQNETQAYFSNFSIMKYKGEKRQFMPFPGSE